MVTKEKTYHVEVQSPKLSGIGVHITQTTQSYTIKTDKTKTFIRKEFKEFLPRGFKVSKIVEKK
jgi:hypothetical protein